MNDRRSRGEKYAWEKLGPPLYYCQECMLKVKIVDGVPMRKCEHDGPIIAPRRAIVAGVGGLSATNKAKQAFDKAYSAVLGRTR